jgi:tetratricopeptide (TPR) repeat protein
MKKFAIIILLLFIGAFSLIVPAQKADDNLAMKKYQSGMAFYKEGKYEEAMKDLDGVIEKFPSTNWAALSLFQKGVYYKDVALNTEDAKKNFERLAQDFPHHKKAPLALLNVGAIQLLSSDDTTSLNDPLATFERIIRIYPWSENTAEAAYKAAGIYFRIGNIQKAMDKIKLIDDRFSSSSFYGDAVLLKAIIFIADSEYMEAAKQLQELSSNLKGSIQAVKAKKYLNAIQRLKLDTGYKYKVDSTFKLDASQSIASPQRMYLDDKEQILVFDSESKTVYIFDDKGAFVDTQASTVEAIAFYQGINSKNIFVDAEGNIEIDGQSIPLTFSDGDQSRPVIKPRELCVNDFGNLFVVSRKGDHIFRYDAGAAFRNRVSKYEFENIKCLELDNFSRLYVIDDSFEGILIFNLTGLEAGRIPGETKNYKMKEPVKIKFDKFNHMFIFDKDLNAFLVFDNDRNFIKQIPVPSPVEDVIDFAVSDSAEIFVLDEDQKTVLKLF